MSEDLFWTNCNLRVGDRVDSWHMPVELRWSNVAYNIDKTVVTESRENRDAWSEEFVQTYKDELYSTNFACKWRFQYSVPMWTNQLISLCVHCTEQPPAW